MVIGTPTDIIIAFATPKALRHPLMFWQRKACLIFLLHLLLHTRYVRTLIGTVIR
jgi:hypothetical protein